MNKPELNLQAQSSNLVKQSIENLVSCRSVVLFVVVVVVVDYYFSSGSQTFVFVSLSVLGNRMSPSLRPCRLRS